MFDRAELFEGCIDGDWTRGLSSLSSAVGASACGITFLAPDGVLTQHWLGLDAAFDRAYQSHYHRFDPWAAAAAERGFAPGLVVSSELVPADVLAKNQVVNELHRTSGLSDLMALIVHNHDGFLASVGVMRPSDGKPFAARDQQILASVLSPFRKAIRLMSLRDRAAGAPGAAVFYIDRDGRVIDLDPRARALVADADGLRVVDGFLRLHHRPSDHELRHALTGSARRAFISAPRRSAARPFLRPSPSRR